MVAAGVEPNIKILDSDAKTAVWTAAGTADAVMSMTYEQLLVLTEGKAMAVR